MGQLPHMKWFEDWFKSPYYHILYQDRNLEEAEQFIDNLIPFLNPDKNAIFLDLACGKGRHARYINKKGFRTIGIDLSSESISYASQFENDTLQFYVQDMRKAFRINYFSHVLNLFTSFGYFEFERDDLAVMHAVHKSLQPNGIFVLDFMNVQKVMSCLVHQEEKTVGGITFHINKQKENNFIIKRIRFSDKGQNYDYQERVKALTLRDFEKYLAAANLKIVNLFGNYQLLPFDPVSADRLIIIARKN
jgi:SAM-dependent methyltransferase